MELNMCFVTNWDGKFHFRESAEEHVSGRSSEQENQGHVLTLFNTTNKWGHEQAKSIYPKYHNWWTKKPTSLKDYQIKTGMKTLCYDKGCMQVLLLYR